MQRVLLVGAGKIGGTIASFLSRVGDYDVLVADADESSMRRVAEAASVETIKLNASHADAHFQLGMALLNEGKLPEAVTSFESYLKLAPDGQYATQAKGMIAQLKK